jgi:hypothetical protein
MSDQHPNPKNKVPGKNASGGIHNVRRTKGSDRSRSATGAERTWNANEDPPNRAGKVARKAALRKKAAEGEE